MNGFVLPAQVAAVIPGLSNLVDTVGTMKLLGGGTIMGVFETLGMFALMTVLIFLPNVYEMSNSRRLAAVALTFYFTMQAVLFTRIPSEFLYFQF